MAQYLKNLNISLAQEAVSIPEGLTASRQKSSGTANLYTVKGDERMLIFLTYTYWHNGEEEVAVMDAIKAPSLHLLKGGRHRLTVIGSWKKGLKNKTLKVIALKLLSSVKGKKGYQMSLRNANLNELNNAAQCDIRQTLIRAGAIDVDKRELLIDDQGPSRNAICAIFPEDNELVPVLAFCLTRITPLL
jgi:hypothetical protein